MSDDDSSAPMWSDASRASYVRAGEALLEAVRQHVSLVVSADSVDDWADYSRTADGLRECLVNLADAEFRYCESYAYLIDKTKPYTSDEVPGEPDEEEEIDPTAVTLSVLSRRDFRLENPAQLFEAALRAHQFLWPGDPAADFRQAPLENAIRVIVEAEGVGSVGEKTGMLLLGEALEVVEHDDMISADPDRWPLDPFELPRRTDTNNA